MGTGIRSEAPDRVGTLMSDRGEVRNMKRTACIVTGLVIVLLAGLVLSPRYLVYADRPAQSDIVVLFTGPSGDSRLREARLIVQEGYSDYLFIPALFSLCRTNHDRTRFIDIWFTDIQPGINIPQPRKGNAMSIEYFRKIRSDYYFPRFYEDTHAEILLAKKAMDACGFKSAIFISSPFHMRRIKIITDRVFDSSYDIKLVPSRFEKKDVAPVPSQQDLQHVFTEFPKMVWFLCYDLWDRSNGANQIKAAQ